MVKQRINGLTINRRLLMACGKLVYNTGTIKLNSMRYVQIINTNNQLKTPLTASYCDSFSCRLRGLMFTRTINFTSGLLIVERNDSIMGASIHMMFMNYDIAAIWINSRMEVVDVQRVQRWRLSCSPQAPARFILETHPDRLDEFKIGDNLHFEST